MHDRLWCPFSYHTEGTPLTMRAAVSALQKCLSNAFTKMHALCAEALLGTVGALLRGRRLILIELARAMAPVRTGFVHR